MISSSQIEGVVRAVLLLVSGYAVKYGIDQATWAIISGGLVAMATAGWSIYSNRVTGLVEQAAQSPEVTKIVVETQKMATDVPSPKVVPHDSASDL